VDVLTLNGTHQLLVYTDNVNILTESVHTIKKNAETFVATCKETGLEENADKTKYMVMSRDQNAGRSHDLEIDYGFFERVEEFKCMGRTITNQNSIDEEIKSRLKSRNACYHSVQNLLSSGLISKNLKIKVYRIIIFPVVFYGCETWSLTLREERRLGLFKNRELRRIFGPTREEVTEERRKRRKDALNDLYSSPNIIRVIKSRIMS